MANRLGATCALTIAVGLACAALGSFAVDLDPLDPLAQPSAQSASAPAAFLVAATRAGDRLVAAGEAGVIVYSDDNGRSWKQARVPVSVSITGLHFATPTQGWAVGHSGVVLASGDGGQSWTLQLDGNRIAALPETGGEVAADAPPANPGDPLLDVYFSDPLHGHAVGAFGLLLSTADGGRTWVRRNGALPNPEGRHLYAIRPSGDALYVVGESGSIFVSHDRGTSFARVESPYEGSFFGLASPRPGELLVFGLRGNAFHSADGGAHWSRIDAGTGASWTGAALLAAEGGQPGVLMVSQSGEVAVSRDGGRSFSVMDQRLPSLSGVVATADGRALATGVLGVKAFDLPAHAGQGEGGQGKGS